MSKRIIEETLETAKELGIQNILALRGDPPREEEYRIDSSDFEGSEEFSSAVDLIRFIKKQYGDYFCIGVAGYPEGHSDESHPVGQDPKDDMPYLLEKIRAGGDFVISQLFFDESAYIAYEKLVREWDGGAMRDLVIIPGLLPIQNFSGWKRTTDLSHARVPPAILGKLVAVKADDERVKQEGIQILSSMIEKIKSTPSPLRRGFHLFTLNLEKVVSLVLEKCDLIPRLQDDDTAIEDSASIHSFAEHFNIKSPRPSSHRMSSAQNHLSSRSRPNSSHEPPSRATTLAIMHGIGSLGREATWDDYPNGRFGNARSPAFGEIDGYGTSIHLSPAAARAKWGTPTSRADISKLFTRYLHGELDQLPWSEGPLNAETRVIESQLCKLIEKRGWWSIASQPAADGVKSSDPVFGWGPPGGFCFQKAFVEFWIPAEDWHGILKPHLTKEGIRERVSWYAASNPAAATGNSSAASTNGTLANGGMPNANGISSGLTDEKNSGQRRQSDDEEEERREGEGGGGEFESSSPTSAVDSVTWGSFPGKEIVTPTIIEEMSFRAWVDEAHGIWREWERCYAPASPVREVLRKCREDVWLVNVIGHTYQEKEELWEILMGA